MRLDKKKMIAAIIVACTTLFIAIGIHEKKDTRKQLKFGATYMTMNNPYFVNMDENIEESVQAKGDILITRDPLQDQKKQNEQIKDMINEGIDVLFLQPVDRNKVRPALELCKKKHIPVVVIDSEVSDTEAVVSTIVSDNYDAGVQCAKDMMKKKTSANIIIVNQKALNSINERVKGFRNTIKGHPQYKIVEEKESAAEFEIAMKVMEEIIYEKKNYDVVMGGNDPIALGCIAAMQMTDKTDQVMVYGVDGSPDGKAMIKAGFLEGTAAQSPIKIGEKAVQTAYSYLAGETVKKHVTIPVELITADNLKLYDMTGWQ